MLSIFASLIIKTITFHEKHVNPIVAFDDKNALTCFATNFYYRFVQVFGSLIFLVCVFFFSLSLSQSLFGNYQLDFLVCIAVHWW